MIDIYEVVKKLVGEIEPIGETRTDEARFENLKVMTDLVDKLITDIDGMCVYEKNHQASMKKAAKYASDFLTRLGIEE